MPLVFFWVIGIVEDFVIFFLCYVSMGREKKIGIVVICSGVRFAGVSLLIGKVGYYVPWLKKNLSRMPLRRHNYVVIACPWLFFLSWYWFFMSVWKCAATWHAFYDTEVSREKWRRVVYFIRILRVVWGEKKRKNLQNDILRIFLLVFLEKKGNLWLFFLCENTARVFWGQGRL